MINALVKNAELTTGHIAVVTPYVNADMWSLMLILKLDRWSLPLLWHTSDISDI